MINDFTYQLKLHKRVYSAFLLLILCTLFGACGSTSSTLSKHGIEKRHYTQGYHLDLFNKSSLNQDADLHSLINKVLSDPMSIAKILNPLKGVANTSSQTSLDSNQVSPLSGVEVPKAAPTDSIECGDEIIFRTGDRVMARVLSVGIGDITYKRCDNLTGPTYTQKKSEVFMIEYNNGTKDVFETHVEDEYYVVGGYKESAPPTVVRTDSKSIASLVLGILSIVLVGWGGFALGIMAIVYGRRALQLIQESAGTIKGDGIARGGITMGIVSIGISLLILALAIAFFLSF